MDSQRKYILTIFTLLRDSMLTGAPGWVCPQRLGAKGGHCQGQTITDENQRSSMLPVNFAVGLQHVVHS